MQYLSEVDASIIASLEEVIREEGLLPDPNGTCRDLFSWVDQYNANWMARHFLGGQNFHAMPIEQYDTG